MKKLAILGIVALLLAVALPSAASAWQEGPSTDWWYIDPLYEKWKDDGTLGLEPMINGDSSSGQVFLVGDTITISGWLHAVAASCAGGANGAYTEWLLDVSGPSGTDSTSGWDYDDSSGCAEVDTLTTLTITYDLTNAGTHIVYMSSYAAVSQYWEDVADELIEALLTFEVVLEVDIDIKPGSDPNSINTKSKGVIAVAILGSATFVVTTVDVTTLDFEGAPPAHDLTDAAVYAEHLQDVNLDGYDDLVSHYRVQDTGLAVGDDEATLTGKFNGADFFGSDSVNIVK